MGITTMTKTVVPNWADNASNLYGAFNASKSSSRLSFQMHQFAVLYRAFSALSSSFQLSFPCLEQWFPTELSVLQVVVPN